LRLGRTVVVVAAVTLSLALPGAAWACNDPAAQSDGGDPVGGTGPGEPVYFLVYDVDEGATFEITLEGDRVASGEVTGSSSRHRGTFPMPDLGNRNGPVTFNVRIDHPAHEDGPTSWNKDLRVAYRGTTASATPSPPEADRPSAPQPRPTPEQLETPTQSQPTGVGGSAPTGGTGGVPPTGPTGSGGGPTTPSASSGPSGGMGGTGAAVVLAEDQSVARAGRAPAPAARAALSDTATDGARRPLLVAGSVARLDQSDGSGRMLLLLIALTAAGSAAAFAVRWRRGGSGPAAEVELPLVPSDPAVEAELQEMIAEERAKLPRAPDERPPAELAAARDDPG
jgi:hypothetical protein